MTDQPVPPTPSGVDEEAWRAAISAIRGFCGWHIAPVVTEDIKVDGSGGGLLLLPTRRLMNVTAVTNNGDVILDSDVHWSPRGTVRGPCPWSMDHYGAVEMTITHGYEDFPADALAVARALANSGFGTTATMLVSGPHTQMVSEQGQAGAGALSPMHERVLEKYRVRAEL